MLLILEMQINVGVENDRNNNINFIKSSMESRNIMLFNNKPKIEEENFIFKIILKLFNFFN